MQRFYKIFLFIITVTAFGSRVLAQGTDPNAPNPSVVLGIGGGLVYGINEVRSHERELTFEGRATFLWRHAFSRSFAHGFGYYFAPELGISYVTLGVKEPKNVLYGFKSNLIATDLRLRYYPTGNQENWAPYIYGGLGFHIYNNTVVSPDSINGVLPTKDDHKGVGIHFPFGVGLTHYFNRSIGINLAVGGNGSLNDRMNAALDDVYDGYWTGVLTFNVALDNGDGDTDGDGLSDNEEQRIGTNPNNPDTDGDGLSDGKEVDKYETNPLNSDTDGDGLKDGREVNDTDTDPKKADSDGDGLTDGDEVDKVKSDPKKMDTDGDGLNDGEEVKNYKTDPLKADTDGDTLSDGDEVKKHKTDPLNKDTDQDGLYDNVEINTSKTNPTNPDTDGDTLRDGEEVNTYKTNPNNPDTDGGTVADGVEVKRGTNPLDANDDIEKKKQLVEQVGRAMVLEGVVFETGKSRLLPESEQILTKALEGLLENPDVEVMIGGHTDNVGRREKNMKLSADRAESVKAWLVSRGVKASRIATKGFGPDSPIAPNDTDEGKQKNRRIEFTRTK